MTLGATLERWAEAPSAASFVLELARRAGSGGFTVDDLRLEGWAHPNPGSVLGRMVARGQLLPIGRERSNRAARKGAPVERYIITGATE